jgi:hypothetical protein
MKIQRENTKVERKKTRKMERTIEFCKYYAFAI